MTGTLFLVATPIGNLGDLSDRARQTLASVAFVACEDTRRSRVLLEGLGLRKETVSLPAFAEAARTEKILDRVARGEDCALISDAGTPGINDPGEKLVEQAVGRGLKVVPVPGPSAVIAALSVSGLSTGRFHFLGFLPRKGPDRSAMVEEVRQLGATLVLYESPRRLVETLADLAHLLGDRQACVARELTKSHEEILRGPLSELAALLAGREVLGEVVLMVAGSSRAEAWPEERMRLELGRALKEGERLKTLAKRLAKAGNWRTGEVYELGLKIRTPE